MLLTLLMSIIPNLEYLIKESEYQQELSELNFIQRVLVKNELMDIREKRQLFNQATERDIVTDILIMYGRIVDLRDAPMVWTHQLFVTPVDDLDYLRNFNRRYEEYLDGLLEIQTNSVIRDRIFIIKNETKFLYIIYDRISDAKKIIYYIPTRRKALKELKIKLDSLDKEFFWRGKLPPPVPIWEFNHIR